MPYAAAQTWPLMPADCSPQARQLTCYAQGKTQPPDYLSESELIGLMERHSIGTDASIAVHINNICERNYVKIHAGRRVVPTELGITLVRGYQLIDPELCSPQACAIADHVAGGGCG